MNARQTVFNYLKAHPGVTAAEIARALRVTPANIRHHLNGLLADGLVLAQSQPQGRGRPQKTYRLSDTTLGDNLALLLETLLENIPASQRDAALERLAARLAGPPLPARSVLPRRLSAVVERLSTLNYHPRWEVHASGPRIIFTHCPYAAIIAKHPELCRADAHALGVMLSLPVEPLSLRELNERGQPTCIFRVVQY